MWKQLLALVVGLVAVSCANDPGFTQPGTTDSFVQNFNPEFIDVLWVTDTRSNMSYYSSSLAALQNQAQRFFERLDSTASTQYRMGFINMDQASQGALLTQPLTKNLGSLSERVAAFRNLFGQVLNLRVGGVNTGFNNAAMALSSSFVPNANVPLVMVFITDGNDQSTSAGDPVESFATQYLSAKQNRSDLLRVYSINYMTSGARCFTPSAYASIDNDPANERERYHRLADRVGGAKGDICGNWADAIDLSGLRLQQLKTRFKLSRPPIPDSIQVAVLSQTTTYGNFPFTFDAATNEVVFAAAPPEGSTIQVTYHSN